MDDDLPSIVAGLEDIEAEIRDSADISSKTTKLARVSLAGRLLGRPGS